MRSRSHGGALALLVVLTACSADPISDSEIEALVWIDESGIDIESVEPAERPELPAWGERTLHFALYDERGSVLVEGDVPDPRFLRSETTPIEEEDPGPAPLEQARAEMAGGHVPLFLPAVPGELVLTDQEGNVIGRTRYEPPAEGAARAPLLGPDDVLGRPARVAHHGSKAEKIDILFLAEGYRQAELGRFRDDVSRIVAGLRRQADYDGRRWDWFNVWRQNVRSRSSGADDPSVGREVNTAFDTSYGVGGAQRCLFPSTRDGSAAAHRLRRSARADVVVILVNSSQYGGCASGGLIAQSRRGSPARVLAHEIGHAVFGLADEYEYGTCRLEAAPNISLTDARGQLPWSDLVQRSTPLPTPETADHARDVGAFLGGNYCERGTWRPQLNCLMRELDHTMCAVCSRQMARVARRIRNRETRGGSTPEDIGPVCGDGACGGDETCELCEDDCGACAPSMLCPGDLPSCIDDLGLERCDGELGILACPDAGQTQQCTCTAGDFADCGPCR